MLLVLISCHVVNAVNGDLTARDTNHTPSIVERAHPINPLWTHFISTAVHATHGSLMAIAFVLLFPLGALSQKLQFLGRYKLHFHVGCQMFGYCVVLMGFILGIWCAIGTQDVSFQVHSHSSHLYFIVLMTSV
jgi:hypothetical protein